MKQRFVDSSNREYDFWDDNPKEGGQALVHRASEPATGLVVALKIYKRAFATSAQREWDLLEETMAEDVETHQWLLVPLGRGTWNGRVVLVFPWMDYDLESWASGKSLTRRLEALLLAVEAVARLHRTARPPAGYRVHRDIKPQNILVHEVQERLHVRLTDLGVGKQGEVVESATNTAVFTTRYAPADQALPVSGHPEESWDVHALAVTIFWALTEDWPKKAQHPALGFNARGTTLYDLHRKQRAADMGTGLPLSPAERGQLRVLKVIPRHLLVNTGAEFGWSAQDEDVLIAGLNRFSALPKEVLTAMAVDLLQALEHALDPDPRVRAKQARDLYRGLARLQQALQHHGESIPTKVVPSGVTPNLRDRISNPTWIDDAPSDEDLSEPPSSVSNHEDVEINNLEPGEDPESESPIFDQPGPPVPVATDLAESVEPAQAESESDLPSRVPEMSTLTQNRRNPALRVPGDPEWESTVSAVRVVELPLKQEEAPASWSLSMGTLGLTAADTFALGGMVGVARSHNRAEWWTDVAGLRFIDPVLLGDEQYARWLTAISAGAGWRGGSDSSGLLLGGGAYVYPTLAFGPMGRSGVWFERGAIGVTVEGRVGWDLAQHTADVPRLTVGVGLSAILYPG